MALINCSECGKEVSNKAQSCPNCGNPINVKSEEYICCPKCHSRELYVEQKGFSGGTALAGAVLAGGIGLLAGMIGSKEIQITCLKCENKFKTSEAFISKEENDKSLEEEVVEFAKNGQYIAAVKIYRDRTGLGIEECKQNVESIYNKHNIEIKKDNGLAIIGCVSLVVIIIIVIALFSSC